MTGLRLTPIFEIKLLYKLGSNDLDNPQQFNDSIATYFCKNHCQLDLERTSYSLVFNYVIFIPMKNNIQLKKNQHFFVCKQNSQKQSNN